jgi:O-antigen/teichoic acid export membrane protein
MPSNRTIQMAATVATRFGGKAINLLVFVIVARMLSLNDMSMYGLIITLTLIYSTMLDIGTRNSLAFYIGKQPELAGSYARYGVVQWLLLTLLCYPVMYLSLKYMGSAPNATAYSLPSAALLSGMLYLRIMQGPLLGQGKIGLFNRTELSARVVLLIGTGANLLMPKAFTLSSALWVMAISQLAASAYLLLLQRHVLAAPLAGHKPSSLIGPLLSRGFVFMLGVVMMYVSKRLSFLFVSQFASAESSGLFFTLQRLTEIITEVGVAISAVVFSHSVRAKNAKDAVHLAAESTRISFAIFIAISVVLAIGGKWFLPLVIGKEFHGETMLFLLILLATLAGSVWTMLIPNLSVAAPPSHALLILAPGLVINLITIKPMMNWLGIPGAAISMIVSNVIITASFLFVYKLRFGVPARSFLIPEKSDLAGLSDIFNGRILRRGKRR